MAFSKKYDSSPRGMITWIMMSNQASSDWSAVGGRDNLSSDLPTPTSAELVDSMYSTVG